MGYAAELHLGEMMEIAAFLDEFEPEVVALINRFAKPGNIALDIGANVGLHALKIAANVGPGGRVYAFEPTDFSFRKLKRNLELNPHLNITPCKLALSNENRPGVEIDFRTSWRTDGGRSDNEPSITDFARLDDWIAVHGLQKLDLIKIDVDGFEGLVVAGGMQTLTRFRPIILLEAFQGQFEPGRPDAFVLLESIGYTFRTAKHEERIAASAIRQRLEELRADGTDSFNLFAMVQS